MRFQLCLLIAAAISMPVRAEIRGTSDLKATPSAYTVLFFPDNYRTNQASMQLLNGFATDPALIQLRNTTQVQTYTASDPDFRNRWAAKVPSVANGHPAAIVLQDNQVLWGAVSPTVEQFSRAMRGGILSRIRPCRPNQPSCPTCPPNQPNQPYPGQPYQPEQPYPNQPYQPNQPGVVGPERPLLPNVPLTPEPVVPVAPVTPVQPLTPTSPVTPIPTPQAPEPSLVDDRLDKLEQQITTALGEQKELQEKLTAQMTQVVQMGSAITKPDYTPIINAIYATQNKQQQQFDLKPVLEAITALGANKPDLTAIVAMLNQIKEQTTPATPPSHEESSPLILVTSSVLCDDCAGVTARAREVRDKNGVNIRIVKLDGSLRGLVDKQKADITLDGVPCLYDFKNNRTIVGADTVLEYLNSL